MDTAIQEGKNKADEESAKRSESTKREMYTRDIEEDLGYAKGTPEFKAAMAQKLGLTPKPSATTERQEWMDAKGESHTTYRSPVDGHVVDEDTNQPVDLAQKKLKEGWKAAQKEPGETGELKTREQAETILADPKASAIQKKAAKDTLDDLKAKAKGVEIRNVVQAQNAENTKTSTAADIKPGSEDYKIAEKLATGKLTMTQFRTLFAFSRNATKREAIVNKASEINPAFNPAAFEAQFRFAENPQTQRQVANIRNLTETKYPKGPNGKTSVESLLAASDKAARSCFTDLNKFIVPGGIHIGDRDYSNFRTARIAFADELSLALGIGSATDMAREMSFDMTDPKLGPDEFASSMRDIVVPFIERRKQSLLDQMGVYGSFMSGPGGDTNSAGDGGPKPAGGAKKMTPDEYLKSIGH